MNENLLSIKINVSVEKLFSFTINPNNTHKWIDWIEKEWIEWDKICIWTIYKNICVKGITYNYELINFIENSIFHLKSKDSNLEVIYFYIKISENESILNYFEFMSDSSNLLYPLWKNNLEKLKNNLEK